MQTVFITHEIPCFFSPSQVNVLIVYIVESLWIITTDDTDVLHVHIGYFVSYFCSFCSYLCTFMYFLPVKYKSSQLIS